MSIRILTPVEYPLIPYKANPANSVVVVLEDDNTKEIKGYWVAQTVVHIEPVWLADDVKGGIHGLKMYAGMMAALSSHGITTAYAFADRPEIADYLERLQFQLEPFVVYRGQVPLIVHEDEPLPV